MLRSGGAITQAAGRALTVTGNASFADTAAAGITLDATNTFGTLTFNSSGAVLVLESDNLKLAGDSTAASLILRSGGAVSEAPGASLTVTGHVDLLDTTGAGITLDQTNNFGTLTFSSIGVATITEASDMQLVGVNAGGNMLLTRPRCVWRRGLRWAAEGSVAGLLDVRPNGVVSPACSEAWVRFRPMPA